MVDERLLAAVRRFWTPEEVSTNYRNIFAAYSNRAVDEVKIIGTSFEGESTQGQLVMVSREDFLSWLGVLEERLREIEAVAAGTGPLDTGYTVANMSRRRVGT